MVPLDCLQAIKSLSIYVNTKISTFIIVLLNYCQIIIPLLLLNYYSTIFDKY